MAIQRPVLVVAIAIAIAASSGAAHAQKQTAAGAQKFLATVGQQGSATVLVSDMVPVILAREGEEARQENYRFVRAASSVAVGSDLCHTAAQSATVSPAEMASRWVSGNEWQQVAQRPPVVLRADIDWSRATIKRGGYFYSPDGQEPWFTELKTSITAQIGNNTLTYRTENPELLDRIEFAMKFMQVSCDRTSDTGF